MKKINKFLLFTLLTFCITGLSYAQDGKMVYGNVNWQWNLPISNSFVDGISGWGAHGEVGYKVTEKVGIGAFLSFHTNNTYIDRQTLSLGETGSVTTDQQHSVFQIPFGAAFRYTIASDNLLEPFFNANIGANKYFQDIR